MDLGYSVTLMFIRLSNAALRCTNSKHSDEIHIAYWIRIRNFWNLIYCILKKRSYRANIQHKNWAHEFVVSRALLQTGWHEGIWWNPPSKILKTLSHLINKNYQRMMVGPMFMIVQNVRSFLATVTPTDVTPTAVILLAFTWILPEFTSIYLNLPELNWSYLNSS